MTAVLKLGYIRRKLLSFPYSNNLRVELRNNLPAVRKFPQQYSTIIRLSRIQPRLSVDTPKYSSPKLSKSHDSRCNRYSFLHNYTRPTFDFHSRIQFRHFHESRDSKIHGTSEAPKEGPSGRSAHELYDRLAGSVTRLESATKVYGYSTFKIAGAILLLSGAGMFVFREVIRDNVAGEVSTVATKTLSDESLQQKTQEITIDLLHTVFQSPQIQHEAVKFLEGVLAYPATQAALTSLLFNVIRRPDTKSQLAHLLKDVVNQSLCDDAFRKQLAQNLKLLLADDSTKQAVLEIHYFVLNDDEILEATKDFVQQILASSRVQHEASQLGKRALDDIVSDPKTQQHTGDALWNAFQYSITPAPRRWFQSSKEQQQSQPKTDSTMVNIQGENKQNNLDSTELGKQENKQKKTDGVAVNLQEENKEESGDK